ncbi:MAG TPA: putative quinol monooxygenase [Frankiaceae bacterium]
MSAPPVVLVAVFEARPDTAAELAERLQELVPASRSEPGCLGYALHRDTGDPLRFVFVETWLSERSLAVHDGMPLLAALRADLPRLVAAPPVVHRLRELAPA